MSNINWPRWIFASISKHFQNIADANDLYMHIEGVERSTNKQNKWIELRVDGPNIIELSKNYFRLDIEINILLSIDLDHEDFHKSQKFAGILANAMTDICIYRYGDGVDDDDSFLGILTLKQDAGDVIRINNLGETMVDVQIVHGTIEGSYEMFLSN